MLLHVNDEAGTGKSKVIDIISRYLFFHSAQRGVFYNPIMRAAPIGVAAHNIHNITLHRLLSLPIKEGFQSLKEKPLERLQDIFRNYWLLIINEKSIIDAQILYQIDRQLRQITCNHNVFYERINILFCDDFGQLPLVLAIPLYSTLSHKNEHILTSHRAYTTIDQMVILTQIMRQQNNSPTAVQFRETLNQLRNDPISMKA